MLQNKILQPDRLNDANIVNSVKTYSRKKNISYEQVSENMPKEVVDASQFPKKQQSINKSPSHDFLKKYNVSFKNNSICATNGTSSIAKEWNEMEFLSNSDYSPSQILVGTTNDSLNGGYARTRKNLVEKFKLVDESEKNKSSKDNILSKANKNLPANKNVDETPFSSKKLQKRINETKLSSSGFSTKIISNNEGIKFLNAMVKKFGPSHNLNSNCLKKDSPKSDSQATPDLDKFGESTLKSKKDSLSSITDKKTRLMNKKASSSFKIQSKELSTNNLTPSKCKRVKKSDIASLKECIDTDLLKSPDNQARNSNAAINSLIKDKDCKNSPHKSQFNGSSGNRVPDKDKDNKKKDEKRKTPRKRLSESTFGTGKKVKQLEGLTAENDETDLSSKSDTNENNVMPVQENIPQITEKDIASFLDAESVKETPNVPSIYDGFPINDIQVSNLNTPIPNIPSTGISNLNPESLTTITPPILLTSSVSNTLNPYVTPAINNGFIYLNSVPTYQPAITNTIPSIQTNNISTLSNFPSVLGNSLAPFTPPLSSPTPTNIYIVNVPCSSCQSSTISSPSHSSNVTDNNLPPVPIIQLTVTNSTEVPSILNTIIQTYRYPSVNNQNSHNLEFSPMRSQLMDAPQEDSNLPCPNETSSLGVGETQTPCNKTKEKVHSSVDGSYSLYVEETLTESVTAVQSAPTFNSNRGDMFKVKPSRSKGFDKRNAHFLSHLFDSWKIPKNRSPAQCKLDAKRIFKSLVPFHHHRFLKHFYKNVDVFAFLSPFVFSNSSYKNVAFKYSPKFNQTSFLNDVLKDFVSFHLEAILKALHPNCFPVKLSLLLKHNHSKLIIPEKELLRRIFSNEQKLNLNDIIAGLFFIGLITIFVEFKQSK